MEAKDSTTRLAEALGLATWILQRGQRQVADPIKSGLLRLLADGRKLRPSEAAKVLDVAASSITRHAQTLQADGRISLVGDPADRRSCFLAITDDGRAELTRLERAGVEYLRTELADWAETDVDALAGLLGRLCDTLAEGHARRQRSRATWRDAS